MAKANVAEVMEQVEIGLQHLDEVADSLYKRLQEDEKEQLIKLFIKKETAKKIEEANKRGKPVVKSIPEFTLEIEKRMLNKLVYLEAKAKIMGRQR